MKVYPKDFSVLEGKLCPLMGGKPCLGEKCGGVKHWLSLGAGPAGDKCKYYCPLRDIGEGGQA